MKRFGFGDDDHLEEGRLTETRSQFLGLMRDMHAVRKGTFGHFILPHTTPLRRLIKPRMAPPLRTRRDYTSVGRPTFLVEQLELLTEDPHPKPSDGKTPTKAMTVGGTRYLPYRVSVSEARTTLRRPPEWAHKH